MTTNFAHPIVLLCLFTGVGLAQAETRLQVGLFSESARADAVAADINKAGYGPSLVRHVPEGAKVLTRAFPTYAEANLMKPKLRETGYNDVFAVDETSDDGLRSAAATPVAPLNFDKSADFASVKIDFEALGSEITSSSRAAAPVRQEQAVEAQERAALRKVSNETASEAQLVQKVLLKGEPADAADAILASDAFLKRYPASAQTPKVKLYRGYWLIKNGQREEAKQVLEELIQQHPDSPVAGEAHLRLGYLKVNDSDRGLAALQHFTKVALGEIPASPADRVDAILRCAALYHRGKDLEASRLLYLQVEESAAIPEEVRAFAMLQRAGLVMEQAWNQKAEFADSRVITEQLLSRFPKVHPQTRATAAIIQIESYVHEKKYQQALDESEKLEALWKNAPESPVAVYWVSKCYAELGNHQEATVLLESVLDAKLKTGPRFRDVNIENSARRLASDLYQKMGKADKAREVLQQNNR